MYLYKRSSVLVFLIVCLMAGAAQADVPSTISFQGRMKDSTGTPYTGSKLVKFTIYDGTGTEIWNSGFNSTTFADGLVTVQLGAPPHPVLPTGNWLTDTALTLGITVDTDPEITPRIPFSATGYAFQSLNADQFAGMAPGAFVHEAGDTMSGPLTVLGHLNVGTDSNYAPLTVQSGSNWSWDITDGQGDFRIGDSAVGFSIGIALGGGGTGATRLWTQGGVEDIYLGGPTNGEQLMLKGLSSEAHILSDLSIGTELIQSPLTLQSQDKWRWDVDSGRGDFRIGDAFAGFNIGIALAGGGRGATRMWSQGGLVEDLAFGSATFGDMMYMRGDSGHVRVNGSMLIGTNIHKAPLTLQSENQSRWNIGTGFGDFRLDDGSGGLSIGVASSGEVSFWSSDGTSEDLVFGNPTFGEMLRLDGTFGSTLIQAHDAFRISAPDNSNGVFYSPAVQQLSVFGGSDVNNKVSLFAQTDFGSIHVSDSNSAVTTYIGARAFGSGGGIVQLSKRDLAPGAELKAGANGAGAELSLYDGGGSPAIQLLPGSVDDAAVVFPDNAISNSEILDEPGIAFNRRTTSIPNLPDSSISQDFVSVDMTIPADGYIILEGVGYFSCQGDLSSFGWIQISETSNRPREGGQYHWVGPTGFGNSSSAYTYESIPVRRLYFKTQGTYTFYLQGNAWEINSGTSDVDLLAPTWLQATYYPVAYGTANAIVESPGDMESAALVSVEDPLSGESSQVYQVDLRELELKSKTARLKVLEAEKEALKADLELQRARSKEVEQASVHAKQAHSEVQQ